MLPSSLTSLSFSSLSFKLESLPPKLIHLDLGLRYCKPIPPLPSSITRLNVGPMLDFKINDISFPSSLTHLSFGDSFNRPVDSLPNSLTYLHLGNSFDTPINSLPSSLTYLDIHRGLFNQSVDSLPSSLTHLDLSQCFNHPINYLPPSLTHLIFPQYSFFNHNQFSSLHSHSSYFWTMLRSTYSFSSILSQITFFWKQF